MFKQLAASLKSLTKGRPKFDPATIEDPVATLTAWEPLKKGGSNFCTHKLVSPRSDRIEFQVTTAAKAFYMIFVLLGVGVVIGATIAQLKSGRFALRIETLLPLFFGTMFFAVGTVLLRQAMTPIVFDQTKGFFWKGRKAPDEVFNIDKIKDIACWEEIYALQLISEYCSSDKSSYYSYEMNLVLQNGERFNVVDHGNKSRIREDAMTLAAFLNVPVWDGILD